MSDAFVDKHRLCGTYTEKDLVVAIVSTVIVCALLPIIIWLLVRRRKNITRKGFLGNERYRFSSLSGTSSSGRTPIVDVDADPPAAGL